MPSSRAKALAGVSRPSASSTHVKAATAGTKTTTCPSPTIITAMTAAPRGVRTTTTTTTEKSKREGRAVRKGGTSSSSIAAPECPICLDLLYCPVTTTCGHTFCFHCLFLSTIRDCPLCRHGPLLPERGDFEADAIAAMRVRIELTVAAASSSSHHGLSSSSSSALSRPNNAARGGAQQSGNSYAARERLLPPVATLLASYEAAMREWSDAAVRQQENDGGEGEEDQPIVSSSSTSILAGGGTRAESSLEASSYAQRYAAASLATRAQLGRRQLSRHTYDDNATQQMFFEGGFMWRRAPSIAVQPALLAAAGEGGSSARGDGERAATAASGGGGYGGGAQTRGSPATGGRLLPPPRPPSGHQRTHQMSHIDHLLMVERRRRGCEDADVGRPPSAQYERPQSQNGGGLGRGAVNHFAHHQFALHQQQQQQQQAPPLPPLTITPRGKVWATPLGVGPPPRPPLLPTATAQHNAPSSSSSGPSALAVVDAHRLFPHRARPQSAVERSEDHQLIADTRAFVKGQGRHAGIGSRPPLCLPSC